MPIQPHIRKDQHTFDNILKKDIATIVQNLFVSFYFIKVVYNFLDTLLQFLDLLENIR